MKKKKGFTLVELVITISLLAIIGITIVLSLNKTNNARDISDKELVANKIKSAADVYLNGNEELVNSLFDKKSYVILTLKDLKKDGLITDNLIDADTNKALADDTEIMVSLDENGTIKIDYPAVKSKEEYVQALNVYMEQHEKVTCNVGMGTYNLIYVNSDKSYDKTNYLLEKGELKCDWDPTLSENPGTYTVNYSYKLKDGTSKVFTRKYIVEEEVVVNLTGKTTNSNATIQSGQWATEAFNISAKTNRSANIDYYWYDGATKLNYDNKDLPYTNSGSKKYTLKYDVYNKQSDTKTIAYSRSKDFTANLEKVSEITTTTYSPVVPSDTAWHNTTITLNASIGKAPASGVKEYLYCIGSSCTPTSTTSGPITINTNGKNDVSVIMVTTAGNKSSRTVAHAYFDNVAPSYISGSVSGTVTASFTDEGSANASSTTKYYMVKSSDSMPSVSDSGWTSSLTGTTPSCGSYNYYYTYARDAAGNTSSVSKISSIYGGACSSYSGGGYSSYTPSTNTGGGSSSSCNDACQLNNYSNNWSSLTDDQKQDVEDIRERNGWKLDSSVNYTYDPKTNTCVTGCGSSAWNGSSNVSGGSGSSSSGSGSSSSGSGSSSSSTSDGSWIWGGKPAPFSNSSSSGSGSSSSGSGSSSCLVEGTPIKLADGTYKNIENITYDDLLAVYNYDEGKLSKSYPGWIEKETKSSSYQENRFDDGSVLNTVGFHGVFDCDQNKFIDVQDEEDFHIGTRVMKMENDRNYCVTVTSIKEINKTVNYYHVESVRYLNVIANDFITTDGLINLANMYGFNDNLKWSNEKVFAQSNRRNTFTLEEILKSGNYTKHLYEALNSKDTRYLTTLSDIKNDPEFLYALINIANFLTDPSHELQPQKNSDGIALWKVTTSDNYEFSNEKYMEGSTYTLPNPKTATNFAGWYHTGENKVYMPGDKVSIYYATHFIAVYN